MMAHAVVVGRASARGAWPHLARLRHVRGQPRAVRVFCAEVQARAPLRLRLALRVVLCIDSCRLLASAQCFEGGDPHDPALGTCALAGIVWAPF